MNLNLDNGRVFIRDFEKQKCFSSFLPGIAGKKGTPMWVFYVNRGQGIASFGIENKDKAIMEFKPADQSYRDTPLKGFRTFLKIDGEYLEAFAVGSEGTEREMVIEKNALCVKERNKRHNIEVKVTYYTLPNEGFSALVRKVEVINTGEKARNIEVIDGLPELLPYGISNTLYKEMGFTARAWMEVFNGENNIPFYRVRTAVGDTEIVEEIESAYFYLAGSNSTLLDTVYDRNVIFGSDTSMQEPKAFMEGNLSKVRSGKQYTENVLPSAFGLGSARVEAGESYRINSMIGFSEKEDYIKENAEVLLSDRYIDEKLVEAQEITEELVKGIRTRTANKAFDSYCEQNYMDNILRGGYPLVFDTKDGKAVYHVFSRKHGDLERDYNFFSLEPNKYSQGNGNFRDVLQNRRNDIFFNPEVGEFNIRMFMNFIQADGNNPLVIKGTTFKLDEAGEEILELAENKKDLLREYLDNREFTPGEVLTFIAKEEIKLAVEEEEFIEALIYNSKQYEQGVFGEGYWIDHWTYLMDLVDSYMEVFPDRLETILFSSKEYRFFESPAIIRPRAQKYKLYKGRVMQIGAVEESEEKEEYIKKQGHDYLADRDGKIYETNLFAKLMLLATTKFATLDPYGMGLEMEGNKPGWNDALNGLPGMIGSGMSETFELKRLVDFLKSAWKEGKESLVLFKEFADLAEKIDGYLDEYMNNGRQFEYWDKVATAKEGYRRSITLGISGEEKTLGKEWVEEFLAKMNAKLTEGMEKAKEYGNGIYPTYFTYEAVDYDMEGEVIVPKRFEVNPLPYFLEGPTRAFKVVSDNDKKELYKFIKESNIYDKKLKMYKTSESIEDQSHDIGRLRAFTPGWLENESVFMHMEFKYLLEILKGGLKEEFFQDIKTMLPPYLDYETYGRSTLENSSFIVSSANRNDTLHGQGFSARLSGSTAEFLSMWKYIFAGQKLFQMEEGELVFTFDPQIEGEFFDQEGEVEFKLFSEIDVKYINKSRRSTFGEDRAVITRVEVEKGEEKITLEGNRLTGQLAEDLRSKKIDRVTCFFE